MVLILSKESIHYVFRKRNGKNRTSVAAAGLRKLRPIMLTRLASKNQLDSPPTPTYCARPRCSRPRVPLLPENLPLSLAAVALPIHGEKKEKKKKKNLTMSWHLSWTWMSFYECLWHVVIRCLVSCWSCLRCFCGDNLKLIKTTMSLFWQLDISQDTNAFIVVHE